MEKLSEHMMTTDKMYAIWVAVQYNKKYDGARLDQLTLYVCKNTSDGPALFEIPGYQTRHFEARLPRGASGRDFPDEPAVVFAIRGSRRMTGGPLRNRVRNEEGVPDAVPSAPAVTMRRLAFENTADAFKRHSPKDMHLADCLTRLEELLENDGMPQFGGAFPLPSLRLSATSPEVYLRSQPGAMDWLYTLPEVDGRSDLPPNGMLSKYVRDKLGAVDRVELPYEHIYGKGVITTGDDNLLEWFEVPDRNLDPHLIINLENVA